MVHLKEVDPHNFISIEETIDEAGEELQTPPDDRMPIRGEKYTFTYYPPNSSETQLNPAHIMALNCSLNQLDHPIRSKLLI